MQIAISLSVIKCTILIQQPFHSLLFTAEILTCHSSRDPGETIYIKSDSVLFKCSVSYSTEPTQGICNWLSGMQSSSILIISPVLFLL